MPNKPIGSRQKVSVKKSDNQVLAELLDLLQTIKSSAKKTKAAASLGARRLTRSQGKESSENGSEHGDELITGRSENVRLQTESRTRLGRIQKPSSRRTKLTTPPSPPTKSTALAMSAGDQISSIQDLLENWKRDSRAWRDQAFQEAFLIDPFCDDGHDSEQTLKQAMLANLEAWRQKRSEEDEENERIHRTQSLHWMAIESTVLQQEDALLLASELMHQRVDSAISRQTEHLAQKAFSRPSMADLDHIAHKEHQRRFGSRVEFVRRSVQHQ